MSRLVVTGATGFLGQALLDELEASGELGDVVALSRRPSPDLAARGVEVRVGSLLDPEFVRGQLQPGCTIVHLAGRVEFTHAASKEMHDLHVESTRVLGRAALEVGVRRFVLLSSSGTTAVSRHPKLHDESARYPFEIIARWPYYLSKLLQERLVLDLHRQEGLPAIVLNPSLIFGPGDERGGSTKVIDDYLQRRIPFTPSGGISMVDVRDVARATHTALTRGSVGERYFLGSLNCRFSTFFEILERCSGVRAPALTAPRGVGVLGARAVKRIVGKSRPELTDAISPAKIEMADHFWYVSWQKASAELNFHPRPPEQTLRETVAFLRGGVSVPA
ncbi:MAG: NAD-dependent epimerase/dehydratase family protein [Longimicrobiaceae bacterium]